MSTSNRTVRRVLAGLGAVALTVIAVLFGVWWGGHPSDLPAPLRGGFFQSRGLVLVDQVLNVLTTRYYRPLNRTSLLDQGLSGMVASLDDPYSRYLDPYAYRTRNEQPGQDMGGIGINAAAEPGGLRVVSVVPRSPAADSGLMPADLIVKVGSTSLVDEADNLGTDLIRGPVGTSVELTFLRDDVRHVISVQRAKIVAPVVSWQMLSYGDRRIAHLTLTGFSEGSGEELLGAVRAAQDDGAQALILDLRGNGGGLISEAINVASIFIPDGEIMAAEERGRPRRVYTAKGDAIAATIPMVVLVDHGTASASEIVTAALQDHGRALIVGTQTYGKGVFQVTERLVNGGALDITVGKYFSPNGHNLGAGASNSGAGIIPNVYAADDPRTAADEALGVAERTVAAEVHSA